MTKPLWFLQYDIHIENPHGANTGIKQITLDGTVLLANEIPLRPDGKRQAVRVVME